MTVLGAERLHEGMRGNRLGGWLALHGSLRAWRVSVLVRCCPGVRINVCVAGVSCCLKREGAGPQRAWGEEGQLSWSVAFSELSKLSKLSKT